MDLVWRAFEDMEGGEIYVKRIPSMKIVDVAKAINPAAELDIVGMRPGEKLHEQMISAEDAMFTYAYEGYYKILPMIHNWNTDFKRIKDGVRCPEGFVYSSDSNEEWMDVETLKDWISKTDFNKVA